VTGLLARVPRAAWLCALVALANGVAWSLIVPPFQVPDENAHYAYVQQLAERGTVPRPVRVEGMLSPAEDSILGVIGFYEIVGEEHNPAPFSQVQQRAIEAVANRRLSTRGDGNALSATNNPPLYYALEAIPYKLASSGGVLDRLALMRLLSALMGAATVLVVFLFLRELLPGTPWAWTAGALVAAFQPLFGFMSGGLNSDNLLYLCSAGLLWALVRMFRRGLTAASGALIGAFLGLGLVSKLTLLGFVPAVVLALALGLRRAWSRHRASALSGAAWAVGLTAIPVVAYLAVNRLVWKRGAIPGGVGSVSPGVSGRAYDFREELSHIWQLFLPPVGMKRQFLHFPLWHTWFKGFIGTLGWLDYGFPAWFYGLALAISALVCLLAACELARKRRALGARVGELSVYVLVVLGLCVEIGVESYRYLIVNNARFEQARYMLPLLGLYAAIAALAVRFGGRRWGPALGAALVMLAIGHDIYAQAITIARYYS
jgi:4-amino-4-deoxy-L-arabinose transferase-like glycosyltransferase